MVEKERSGEKEFHPEHDEGIPPCLITIDKEGRWYHQGVEMVHRAFLKLFYRHMSLDRSGRYVIDWEGDRCYVDVEDTPFVVQRVVFEGSPPGALSRFVLHLNDDTREGLSPETLCLGEAHVLYCKVKEGRFPARFSRPAYYQLAAHIEEDTTGRYYLPLNGERYYIIQSP
jgi:hypothetical protein